MNISNAYMTLTWQFFMLLLILFFKVFENEIVWIQIRSYLLHRSS